MIKRTMTARKVRFASKTLCVFSLSVFVLLLSEVGGSLLDPTQIGGELQKFARDALGVDEMQVRTIENFAKSEWPTSVEPVGLTELSNRNLA